MQTNIHNKHTAVFCNLCLMSADVINITVNADFAGNNKKGKVKTSFNWLQHSRKNYLSTKINFVRMIMIFQRLLH